MRIRLEFNPRDCLIGVYWRTVQDHRLSCTTPPGRNCARMRTDLWIYLLPMLPIHLGFFGPWIEEGKPGYWPKWLADKFEPASSSSN